LSFTIEVRNNNVEKALRVMKKKMKRDGIFQELKDRQYYQKPSFKKREAKKRRYINIKKAEKLRRNFL
tara:strand:- start:2004 stop:2207 length:204 start_codon:yes stop_codon:yes gene_type:complete